MLISIITINYNNLSGFEDTVKSVLNQTYNAIEYIVIDGDSDDGSKEFIERHKSSFAYAISEKDAGIYDAMNKGIDQATGNYLLFLNSGDYLADNFVVEKFVRYAPIEALVYGNALIKEGRTFKVKEMPNINGVYRALTQSLIHQIIFFNKSLFKDGIRYDCSYKIAADWAFINDALLFKNALARHIDLVISYYDINGVSSDKRLRVKDRNRYLETTFEPHFLQLFSEYETMYLESINLKKKFGFKQLFKLYELRKNYKKSKTKVEN